MDAFQQGRSVVVAPEGRYSLSLRLTFRSLERTLVDEDVQQAMAGILEALVREHGAVPRGSGQDTEYTSGFKTPI